MKNKKQKETVTSTIENLPKEIRDRIVYVGDASIGKDLNVNSTAKPHEPFPSQYTTISQASEPKEEKIPKELYISINYGIDGDKIKTQLKQQGLKFDKNFIKNCEAIRVHLLTLVDMNILSKKQGRKAFERLNTIINKCAIELTFGDVKYKLFK